MDVVRIILQVLFCILSVGIIAAVMLQPGEDAGLGALTGGSSDTFFSKNKQNSLQGKLNKLTRVGIVAFVVVTLVLLILR